MREAANPPASCRSLFFWAWDDTLEPDEIRRQIRLMHRQGVGGFFMHSRFGLETPYLGEAWDRAVRAAVDEARAQGMEAWIYDEDRWPSGFCGGKVQQAVGGLQGLTMEVTGKEAYAPEGTEVAFWEARVEGDDLLEVREIADPASCTLPTLLVLRLERSGPSPWFNGYPPPDNLNPASEAAFLAFTHAHYFALEGEEFGRTVKGAFTDEPSLHDRHAAFPPKRGWIPWTKGMRPWVAETLGYDWIPYAPHFYFRSPESPWVRHDYWHAVALRYEACYSGQIGSWCRSHGIAFTGHFLQEDRLGLSTRVNGSIMPHYTHQDICGIDLLGEQTDEYLTLKQCASVVHQYAKGGMLVETYAGGGWQFTFEAMKWMGDWMYALGVTRRCQHLALYSLRGCRKRDYPPCFNYQNTWYGKLGILEAYFARLSAVLSQGSPVRDVLLLHPASTAWTQVGCSPYGNPVRRNERDIAPADQLGRRLNALLKWLCGEHYDVDLVDETLLERDGAVVDGALRLASASYRLVVVPEIDSVYPSTLSLLEEYAAEGGTVVVYRTVPSRKGGHPDRAVRSFFASCPFALDEEALLSLITSRVPRPVSVTEGGVQCRAVLAQLRRKGTVGYLFLANNDRECAHEIDVSCVAGGNVVAVDPFTGEERPVRRSEDGSWHERLEATGSRLYRIEEGVPQEQAPSRPRLRMVRRVPVSGPFRFRLDQPNVLTLDKCRYRLAGGPTSGEMEVWEAQQEVRSRLGMVSLLDDEIAQRYTWDTVPHPADGTPLELRFRFRSSIAFPGTLVVETPERFSITLDGRAVDAAPSGYFLDRSFAALPLGRVAGGEHEIVLACGYRNAMELEAVYLTGPFGVSPEREVTALGGSLEAGDWTAQGLFHYPGSVTYLVPFAAEKGERVELRLPRWQGTLVTVLYAGKEHAVVAHGTSSLDLGPAPDDGDGVIEVTVWGSLRNMLGPLHLPEEPAMTGPASFTTKGDGRYHVLPYGLGEGAELGLYEEERP